MKIIINLIKKYFYKEPLKPLGRWNIDYCNNKMNKKVDLSNEDHCGPCGQYIIDKIDKINKKDLDNKNKIKKID